MDDQEVREIVAKQIRLISKCAHEWERSLTMGEIADASRALFEGAALLHSLESDQRFKD